MTVFSFRAANGIGTVFGEVVKLVTAEDTAGWQATSDRFPGYATSAATMVWATAAYREGLDDWLATMAARKEDDDDRSE